MCLCGLLARDEELYMLSLGYGRKFDINQKRLPFWRSFAYVKIISQKLDLWQIIVIIIFTIMLSK